MTPYEIQNKHFDKAMSGYNRDDVHAFLIQVADFVDGMEEEKNELLRKMEILAEKVEEYREDEESLRAALIGAQKLGDSVVRDSRKKAESILEEARRKSDEMLAETRINMKKESKALTQMQAEVAKFKTTILSMYKQHIEIIQTIPYAEETPPHPVSGANEPVMELREVESPTETFEPVPSTAAESGFLYEYEEVVEADRRKKNPRYGSDLKNFFGEDHPVQRKD